MTAKRAAHQHNRVVGKFVKIPEPLIDGKVRCAACSRVVKLTPKGNLRKHRMPNGDPCAHWANYAESAVLETLPDVVIPEPTTQWQRKRERLEEKRPPRLDVGSTCEDCGKWLPGERKVCGACYVQRDTKRHKKRGA